MRLRNEFEVAVEAERVWETLLDIERVARFLPGATIEPGGEDGIYHGTMRVKVGPMTVDYRGSARMGAVDDAARTAAIDVEAKELRGQGTARATIHNSVVSVEGGTRVVAETELQVTGRQAQFGRGIMEDVAGRMLDQFAARFEAYLLHGDAPTPADDESLDLGAILTRTPAVRYGLPALAALVLLVLLLRSRRR